MAGVALSTFDVSILYEEVAHMNTVPTELAYVKSHLSTPLMSRLIKETDMVPDRSECNEPS